MGRMKKGRKLTAVFMLVIMMTGIVPFASASMLTSNPVTISVPVYQLRWFVKDSAGGWVGLHEVDGGVSGFSLADTLFPSGATVQRSDIPPYPATGEGASALHETPGVNGYFTGRWMTDGGTPVTAGTRVSGDMDIYAEYAGETRNTYAVTVSDRTDYSALEAVYPGSLDNTSGEVPEYSDYRLWWTYPHNNEVAEPNNDYVIDWVTINGTLVENYPKESAYLDLSNIAEDKHIEFAFREMNPETKVAFYASQADVGAGALGTVTPSEGFVEVGGDVQFHFDLFYSGSQKNEIAKIMINGERVTDFERGSWSYTVRNVQTTVSLTYTIKPVMGKPTITVVPSAIYDEGDAALSYDFSFSGEEPEDTSTVQETLRNAFDANLLQYNSTIDTSSLEGATGSVTISGSVAALDAEYFIFFDTGTVTVGPRQSGETTEDETTDATTNDTTDKATEEQAGEPDDETAHRVEISTDGNGVVTSPALTDGYAMVEHGSPLTITYQPNEGYEFDSLEVNYSGLWIPLSGESIDTTYSADNVTGPITLRVNFRVAEPRLRLGAIRGTITQPTDEEVRLAEGAPLAVRFEPDAGYKFQVAEIREKDGTWTKVEGITADGGVIEGLAVDGEFRVVFEPLGGTEDTDTDTDDTTPAGSAYTVALRSVGGTITSPTGSTAEYVEGTPLSISYEPTAGNVFRMAQIRTEGGTWEDVPGATATGCVLSGLTADAELCVTFTSPTQYVVQVEATEGGQITAPAMENGYALIDENGTLTITYIANPNYALQKIEVKPEGGTWSTAEIGSNPGTFVIDNITGNMSVLVTFVESSTAKKAVVVTPIVTYMYGEDEPNLGFGISGFYDAADEDSIYEMIYKGIEDGTIVVNADADNRTPAGEERTFTTTGSTDALGEKYDAGFSNGTFVVTKRPINIKAQDKLVVLGESFQFSVEIGPYNGEGGPLKREGEVIVCNVIVEDNEAVSEVKGYNLIVIAKPEDSPNYEVHTEDGILTVTGKVTYKTNYPEGSGLEDTTFVDPVDYERDAVVTTPEIGNTGFNTTGLTFKGWIINDKVYGAGTKFKMGPRHVELSASWEKSQYALTVLHYVEDTTQAVASPDSYLYESGETYSVSAKQVTGYTPKEETKTGVMPANDLTITIYYTASKGNGGNTDDSSGGGISTDNTGGGTGNSGGSGTEAPTGGATVDLDTDTDTDTGSSVDTDGTDADGEGGGSSGGETEDPYEEETSRSSRVTPNYTIQENDIPLGGVAARNVGDCFE